MIDKSKILIVDDKPKNLFVLEKVLSDLNADLIKATNGNDALKATLNHNFALAILDVQMPEMDGYELAKFMRGEERTKEIPIMFLSAVYSDEHHIFKGYESGAVDFLTKPYNTEILVDKVNIFIELDKHKREIERHRNNLENLVQERTSQLRKTNEQLEELAEKRAKQLIHSDRLATLGVMATEIEHEINNPLGFISSNVQLIERVWGKIEKSLQKYLEKNKDNRKEVQFILKEMPNILSGMGNGVSRITHVVKGFRSFAIKDDEERSVCNINKCIENALGLCSSILKKHVKVEKQLYGNLSNIKANAQQIEQVFINLFVIAAEAMESRENGFLKIVSNQRDRLLCVIIEDTALNIPDDTLERIRDTFSSTENAGLSICYQIIKNHQGKIKAENRPEGGTKFTIELPC